MKSFVHPKTIEEFETIYKLEYEQELQSCDKWVELCERIHDAYGVNFHQGMKAAHIFNNIKMGQLLRILKKESPNV